MLKTWISSFGSIEFVKTTNFKVLFWMDFNNHQSTIRWIFSSPFWKRLSEESCNKYQWTFLRSWWNKARNNKKSISNRRVIKYSINSWIYKLLISIKQTLNLNWNRIKRRKRLKLNVYNSKRKLIHLNMKVDLRRIKRKQKEIENLA